MDNLENIENNDAKLEDVVKSLSLQEFNKVINGIYKDETLSDVEKMIVAKDLHRLAHRDLSYETIGKILGISKVGAFKAEQRALKKLRKIMKKSGISLADLAPADSYNPEDFNTSF